MAVVVSGVDFKPGLFAFGVVHGDVGVLEQSVGGAGVAGMGGGADAGVDLERDVVELEGRFEGVSDAFAGDA